MGLVGKRILLTVYFLVMPHTQYQKTGKALGQGFKRAEDQVYGHLLV